jgi:hypothetical protein
VLVKSQVFWDVMMGQLVNSYQYSDSQTGHNEFVFRVKDSWKSAYNRVYGRIGWLVMAIGDSMVAEKYTDLNTRGHLIVEHI